MMFSSTHLAADKMSEFQSDGRSSFYGNGDETDDLQGTGRRRTREDSPPPHPGIVRDATPMEIGANIFVGPEVNIMFHGPEAYGKLSRGEKVIIIADPRKRTDPKQAQEEFYRRYPLWAKIERSTIDQVRKEWGR